MGLKRIIKLVSHELWQQIFAAPNYWVQSQGTRILEMMMMTKARKTFCLWSSSVSSSSNYNFPQPAALLFSKGFTNIDLPLHTWTKLLFWGKKIQFWWKVLNRWILRHFYKSNFPFDNDISANIFLRKKSGNHPKKCIWDGWFLSRTQPPNFLCSFGCNRPTKMPVNKLEMTLPKALLAHL